MTPVNAPSAVAIDVLAYVADRHDHGVHPTRSGVVVDLCRRSGNRGHARRSVVLLDRLHQQRLIAGPMRHLHITQAGRQTLAAVTE